MRCLCCGSLLGGEYRVPTPTHLHVLVHSLRGAEFKLTGTYVSGAVDDSAVMLVTGTSVDIRFTTGTVVWSAQDILTHFKRKRWSIALGAQALEYAALALNHVLHYEPPLKK